MSRRKVEVRREEILQAAVELVQRDGFAHTRVADIAAALGVSSGLVFYHFGTKEALLAQTLEYAARADLDRLHRSVSRGRDPIDKVRRVLALYQPKNKAPGWTIWVDAWVEAMHSEEMRVASSALDVEWKNTLEAVIREGVESGQFVCPDPGGAAWRLSALLDGLAVQVMVHRTLGKAELAQWVRVAASVELGIDGALLE